MAPKNSMSHRLPLVLRGAKRCQVGAPEENERLSWNLGSSDAVPDFIFNRFALVLRGAGAKRCQHPRCAQTQEVRVGGAPGMQEGDSYSEEEPESMWNLIGGERERWRASDACERESCGWAVTHMRGHIVL